MAVRRKPIAKPQRPNRLTQPTGQGGRRLIRRFYAQLIAARAGVADAQIVDALSRDPQWHIPPTPRKLISAHRSLEKVLYPVMDRSDWRVR